MKVKLARLKFLGRTSVIVLILLALYATLGSAYWSGRQERAGLQVELSKLQKRLPKQTSLGSSAELEKELKVAQAEREAARTAFLEEGFNSNGFLETVLGWAEASGLGVMTAEALPVGKEAIQGHSYQVSAFSLTVAGEYGPILAFLEQLEAAPVKGLVVKSADISQTDTSLTASVHFRVYGGVVEEAPPPKATPTPKGKKE